MKKWILITMLSLLTVVQAQANIFETLITSEGQSNCTKLATIEAKSKLEKIAKEVCGKSSIKSNIELKSLVVQGNEGCYTFGTAKSVVVASLSCSYNETSSMTCYNSCMDIDDNFSKCHGECGLW